MNEHQIVSLISLTGFLVLVAAGFRAREVGWRKGFFMAGAWAGIFAVVILFIDKVSSLIMVMSSLMSIIYK